VPICKKCDSHFPNRIEIDGKMRNIQRRKYCLECSPFNGHNTIKLETLPPGVSKGGISRCKCSICGREYVYTSKNRKGHTRKICNSCSVNTRRVKLKSKSVEYKGGRCIMCGYDKCLAALEFHHKDSSTKCFSFSGSHSRSWDNIKNELDKCDLLCSNCHKELHYNKA
jgi:hypothetical protein